MSITQTVLQGQDTVIQADLYLSFELSDKQWNLTLSDGRRGPSRYSIEAGDTSAVMQCIVKAKARCKLEAQVSVHLQSVTFGLSIGTKSTLNVSAD